MASGMDTYFRRPVNRGGKTFYSIQSRGRHGTIHHDIVDTLEEARRRAQSDANALGEPVWIMRMRGAQATGGKHVATYEPKRGNPSKSLTLRNMALVTIKRLPGGAVKVSGRKMAGRGRKR